MSYLSNLLFKILYSYKAKSISFLIKSISFHTKGVHKKTEPITVMFVANDAFIMMLTVTVQSLLMNYRGFSKLTFYIIDDHISPANKNKFLKSIGTHLQIIWITLDNQLVSSYGIPNDFKNLPPTYFRLLVPYIVPSHIHKVIYLDSDLVVCKDISFLWNQNVDDQVVLAASDTRFPRIEDGVVNYKELGLNPKSKYFNAGVLLINLERWRQLKISEQVLTLTRQYKDFVLFDDQYGLNIALYGRWKRLNPNWNLFPEFFPARPFILHYVSVKPTSPHYVNTNRHFFFRYLDRTEWKGWRPE